MLAQKLRAIRQDAANEDRGFTLIELLVVVVIIGILVAIAIPIYLNYQQGAKSRGAQSDVRNAVATVEQCKADNADSLPTTSTGNTADFTLVGAGTPNPCASDQIVVSSGDTVGYTNNADGTYTITGSDGKNTYSYSSSTGQLTKNPSAAPTS